MYNGFQIYFYIFFISYTDKTSYGFRKTTQSNFYGGLGGGGGNSSSTEYFESVI